MTSDPRRPDGASEDELEQIADRGLARLPLPRAPQTLLPRVMAAVQEWAGRPWYTRAWFTWPRLGQAASIAALLALVTGAVLIAPRVESAAAAAATLVHARIIGDVSQVAPPMATTTTSARILWRTLLEPLANYALVVIVLMVLACAVFGTALNHVVVERAEQR